MVRIQKTAKAVAQIDVFASLATVAEQNNYCRPKLNEKGLIDIKDGRHPVVERMIQNEMFVANDTYLDNGSNRVSIITGPNMAGKSTYMRQSALIVLMAQIGSFVPAKSAKIGIVDRIFTRVGLLMTSPADRVPLWLKCQKWQTYYGMPLPTVF